MLRISGDLLRIECVVEAVSRSFFAFSFFSLSGVRLDLLYILSALVKLTSISKVPNSSVGTTIWFVSSVVRLSFLGVGGAKDVEEELTVPGGSWLVLCFAVFGTFLL